MSNHKYTCNNDENERKRSLGPKQGKCQFAHNTESRKGASVDKAKGRMNQTSYVFGGNMGKRKRGEKDREQEIKAILSGK